MIHMIVCVCVTGHQCYRFDSLVLYNLALYEARLPPSISPPLDITLYYTTESITHGHTAQYTVQE